MATTRSLIRSAASDAGMMRKSFYASGLDKRRPRKTRNFASSKRKSMLRLSFSWRKSLEPRMTIHRHLGAAVIIMIISIMLTLHQPILATTLPVVIVQVAVDYELQGTTIRALMLQAIRATPTI